MCCGRWPIKSFASLQDRQEKFCRRAIYDMIDGSRNTIFLLMKNPQWSLKIENGGKLANPKLELLCADIQFNPPAISTIPLWQMAIKMTWPFSCNNSFAIFWRVCCFQITLALLLDHWHLMQTNSVCQCHWNLFLGSFIISKYCLFLGGGHTFKTVHPRHHFCARSLPRMWTSTTNRDNDFGIVCRSSKQNSKCLVWFLGHYSYFQMVR